MIKQPITKFPIWVYTNTTLPMYLGGGPAIKIDHIIGRGYSRQYDINMYHYDVEIYIGKVCSAKKLFGKNIRRYFPSVIEGSDHNFMLLSKAQSPTLKKMFRTIFNQ